MSTSSMQPEKIPIEKAAAEHVARAFEAIRKARANAESEKRDAEAHAREEVAANLRIVVDARRAHLKLASLFSGVRGASLPLDHAVEIEDGTNTDEREIGIYVRTVSEALVARANRST